MSNTIVKNICPKCQSVMLVKSHLRITKKLLAQPYYYSEWYVCLNCKRVQHFEDNKVFNNFDYVLDT